MANRLLLPVHSWLRPRGDPVVRARVESELRNGAAGDRDRKILRDFEAVLPELAIDGDARASACELARRARSVGASVPATGILIAACARRHGAALEPADSEFERIVTAVPIETYT